MPFTGEGSAETPDESRARTRWCTEAPRRNACGQLLEMSLTPFRVGTAGHLEVVFGVHGPMSKRRESAFLRVWSAALDGDIHPDDDVSNEAVARKDVKSAEKCAHGPEEIRMMTPVATIVNWYNRHVWQHKSSMSTYRTKQTSS